MMKYWILGDERKAVEQSELIWSAYRAPGIFAAPKPLVRPWLKRDWPAFTKQQQKDFEKLWNRACKDGWTVKAENATEVVVTTERYQIEHMWCWAHCGMALLAAREGAVVITDPFWFPRSAVEKQACQSNGNNVTIPIRSACSKASSTMLDSTTTKRFEDALAADKLRELAMEFVAEGLSQAAVYHLFESFHKFLDDAQREADEAALYSSLECIVGYCSPGSKWFDHYLTNEEIHEYRRTNP
jgi:hypothetical protein